jgi:linoleate 9S-lipoxygenase
MKSNFLCLVAATGIGKLSHEMQIENWMESPSPSDTASGSSTGDGTYESRFDLEFKVKKEFGVPGAFIIRNHHRDEFFLKSVTIELKAAQGDEESDHNSTVHFICDSCIYNTKAYKSDRIFFSNKVYLPSDTPEGMVVLRELELINMQGDGTGERKEADRIYDYALYNDLGDSDCHESMKRPVLGGSQELPYPRRLRTGRPPSTTDPENQESRVDSVFLNLYIPRDERHTQVRVKGVVSKEDAILAAGRKLLPALQSLYSTHQEFTSLNNVRDLYKAPDTSSSSSSSSSSTETRSSEPDEDPENQPERMTYPVPKIIAVDEKAWTLDVEFGREWLAGMNPAVIQCLQEFPMISKLDPSVYGNPVSAITVDHIEPFLDGLTVEKAIAEKKLFFVDYHDGFLPYLNKINSSPTSHGYASRTVLFLTSDGTLRPVAIELTLPPTYPGDENIARVFTPPSQGKNWVWEIAKSHVLANDTGYHQLVSHW